MVSWPGAVARDHTANVATGELVRGFESHTHRVEDTIAAPETSETHTVHCRSCPKTALIPYPSNEGHPYGWYHLTVYVPSWFNTSSGKPYRSIGLFCSAVCLGKRLAAIEKDELKHRQAYEAE